MLLAFVLVFVHGVTMAQHEERHSRDFELGKSIEILANMMREMERGYVREVTAENLLKSASQGMLSVTDPYTEYFSEEDMESFEMLTTISTTIING